ncbi:PAS domain S-box protein [Telmatocola sphagniphila]|uniref:Sensor protein FixL n=1 Tax=Telmatocola sphagniphila TaxID=1123043 RepID=A0A8E6ETT5_9BACT|nr:PAS domain S-box protein [Telmatocola sphagniphila]QVL30382.1 PAS domain S-box protein [Telmatocola sphagniphila]
MAEEYGLNENLFHQIMEICPHAFIFAIEGKIEFVNFEACQLLNRSQTSLLHQPLREVVPSEFLAVLNEDEFLAGGEGEKREEIIRFHPGDKGKDLEVYIRRLKVGDREARLFVFQDVTARIARENSIRESESRVTAILDTAVDAIITINDRGIVESFNRAAERIFGYSASEVIGQNVSLLMPAPDRERHDEYIDRYKRTGEKRIIGIGREVIGRKRDGTLFPIDLAVGESQTPKQRRFVGMIRDISDRKAAEARIREQADLLDKVSDAVIVLDLEDRVLYWNRGAERLYKYPASEAVNRKLSELVETESTNALIAAREQVREFGIWDGEFRQTTKGQKIVVESHWTLIRDDGGKPMSIVAIHLDVSERKELEARFLRAQRLESIGTLVSGIAHDLNNVLTPILMTIKLLKKEKPGLDRRGLLETAELSVNRGTAMIKQLLTFAGGMEGERTTVQLDEVASEVQTILEHTLPKSVRLEIRCARPIWPVRGDRTQLAQVVMNLCVNSRDALPGGGLIDISIENRIFSTKTISQYPGSKPGAYVVLSVTDNGTGIAPEVLDKIFDPFFTTKEFGKGTGLGLSTVVGIAKNHGGFVNVYSEFGRGTRINFFIPATHSAELAHLPLDGIAAQKGNGECVLVVDDEPAILMTTQAILESNGYIVRTASGGEEALAIFRKYPKEIRVVVMDMMMPGMDGPTTMQKLHELDRDLKFIATSGLRPTTRAASIISSEAKAFLQKPYSDEQLLQALNDILA